MKKVDIYSKSWTRILPAVSILSDVKDTEYIKFDEFCEHAGLDPSDANGFVNTSRKLIEDPTVIKELKGQHQFVKDAIKETKKIKSQDDNDFDIDGIQPL